jgi:hypothetical protein
MNPAKIGAGVALLALLFMAPEGEEAVVLAQGLGAGTPRQEVIRWTAHDLTRDWPQRPRTLVQAMLEKYGEPSLMDEDALLWLHNGPWRRTTVYRTALYHVSDRPDQDYLLQTIGYDVPADKVAELKLFDKRIEIDPVLGELSACSDSESSNNLVLNLADEIVRGVRSLSDARRFHETTLGLAAAGKSSPYLESLLMKTPYH